MSPQSPLPWVSEPFRQDIGQISTWKFFFVINNMYLYEKSVLTNFRKMVETSTDPHLPMLIFEAHGIIGVTAG